MTRSKPTDKAMAALKLYITGGISRELTPWEQDEYNDLAAIFVSHFPQPEATQGAQRPNVIGIGPTITLPCHVEDDQQTIRDANGYMVATAPDGNKARLLLDVLNGAQTTQGAALPPHARDAAALVKAVNKLGAERAVEILAATQPVSAAPSHQNALGCPDCAKALKKWDALANRMARRGNFGIVPLPLKCKAHRQQP